MNGMDMEQLGQQSFVYGCELKPGKDVVFNPEEDAFEHQLSLRTVSVDPTTKDELQVVEVEGCDANGQTVKTVLASLRSSCLPCVSLAGFEIAPPVVFRLKSGSGPVHLTGQHLILTDGDQSFEDDDEEEEEEEELVSKAAKRPAPTTAAKTQKKMKIEEEEDEDDDEDDDDDDDDDDEDDDDEEEEESEAEEIPVKNSAKENKQSPQTKNKTGTTRLVKKTSPKKTPAKAQPPAQNGRTPSTPAGKPNTKAKTPDAKGDKKAQTPKTPKGSLSMEELKTKMMASVEKGVKLPNVEAKFENFLKNGLRVSDPKIIQDLWKWRQTVKDRK